MRIALATWTSRLAGGVEDYLDALMPALEAEGAEVALWHEAELPVDRPAIAQPQGPSFNARTLGLETSLRRLREWKPDVVYVHGVRDDAAEAAVAAVAPAVRFVHDYATCISGTKAFSRPSPAPCTRPFGAGCLACFFPRGCGGRSPATMWRLFTAQRRRLAHFPQYRAILTHSRYMRDELGRHGIEAHVVPFPVRRPADPDGPAAPGSAWRLIFAGRMETLKGGTVLIDALPALADRCERLHVTFAGDGRERPRWQTRVSEVVRSLPGTRVEFTGWIGEAALRQEIARSHLLVVPSIWPEPFGMVGPMAAQHGVPAVAFASGGLGEWLVDGESGCLAPADPPTSGGLAAAIVRCLADESAYRCLSAGARRASERFTMERHLPALLGWLRAS